MELNHEGSRREIGKAFQKKDILSFRCGYQWCHSLKLALDGFFFRSSLNTCILMYTNLFAFKCPTQPLVEKCIGTKKNNQDIQESFDFFRGPSSAKFPGNFNLGHVYPSGHFSSPTISSLRIYGHNACSSTEA